MSKKPRIFKVHLTISKKPEGNVRFASAPFAVLIFAKSAESALSVAENHVQDTLDKQGAYIKAKKIVEIKVHDVLTDEKPT